jgi:hypothetical protein
MRFANNVGNASPHVRQTFLNDVFTFLTEVGNAGRVVNTGTSSGGGALRKIAPSGRRREIFWGISCEKSRFYTKKSYFFQFYCTPPGSVPGY